MTSIKVYSTPTCMWCEKVKDFLNENDIEFQEIDVSINQEAAREMVEKTGQMGVPVTDIDGKIILGFNPDAINRALGKG